MKEELKCESGKIVPGKLNGSVAKSFPCQERMRAAFEHSLRD